MHVLPSTSGVAVGPLVPYRALASAASPEAEKPSLWLDDTREAWRPTQGPSGFAAEAGQLPRVACTSSSKHETKADSDAAGLNGHTKGDVAHTAAEMDEVFNILQEMGLQPGRHCVVGDGLAEVEVGLYLDGVKVAVDMELHRPSHTLVSDAKSYALKRAMRSVLQEALGYEAASAGVNMIPSTRAVSGVNLHPCQSLAPG
ncbi:hypothetical protein VOLCADRAFT_93521 [Volvox carteri f. nagariensis]|uniref:Uncharacterized protein n=1 Tax=Volvox carteri f. nagariensis TaxID=3068 RepID=D8U2C1_VOLCA|nr:uncharacterized protein VOLCADRAFT_93521 [Volvox carteri f. nagariensis]EFJ46037.1 hypothetical protein VOLCADRAFT_93521 [Volvox carteri f. nagariensis]|eukprot:XP_002952787.1 hypothetical protein VOLCADRAFT_93521 [Volvox carteri f. nagariensis]